MVSNIVNYNEGKWTGLDQQSLNKDKVQLVLVFAERNLIESGDISNVLKKEFKNAQIVISSTAGEINNKTAQENSAVCIAIEFEKTTTEIKTGNIKDYKNSIELGKEVASQMTSKGLKYIWLIADGNIINGDDLIKGIHKSISNDVIVSGGIAGDGDRFQKTLVGANDDVNEGNIVLIGFYGNHIKIGTGFQGGWDVFGPEREITKSDGNVLYEIDNENALDLYKKYLGKYAEELPSSALLFPISVKTEENDFFIVRTILSIDEKNKIMTFAGNIPQGAVVRFMKSNFDRLINAASDAATTAMADLGNNIPADLAILVSCVGRKLVLSDRVEEELEAAIDNVSPGATVGGFFSYGEISPQLNHKLSHLHNQTITITTFAELS